MGSIGPQLPPHLLTKRKRDEESEHSSRSPSPASKPSASPDAEDSKRRRVVGPAPPPASALREGSEDESSDDDFGPALPNDDDLVNESRNDKFGDEAEWQELEQAPAASKRDDWMMRPPTKDDLKSRADPTKPGPRGFAGKGPRGAGGGSGISDAHAWTETPEQKRQRHADELKGIKRATADASPAPAPRQDLDDAGKAETIREYNEKYRGKSLLEQHRGSAAKAGDDDPSKRAFDYEKDMGIGGPLGNKQRHDMVKKASDFDSRFSSGNYL